MNLYIHIPFCQSKCNYCAFYSVAQNVTDAYLARLIADIKFWGGQNVDKNVTTIFFGGGTPSLMSPEQLRTVMNAVRANFTVAPDAEITMESNPGTIDADKMRAFADLGVSRISIGAQSLDDDALNFLGRKHTADDARMAIQAARALDLHISADFIYSLPGQSTADIEKMCADILALNLDHVSMYELSLEPGTKFANLTPNSDDINAAMYSCINKIFDAAGLHRYEVSNYARSGHVCRHNSNIWAGQEYIGIGAAAAGRVKINNRAVANSKDGWNEIENTRAPVDFVKKITPMSDTDRAVEKIITGLRTLRGVALLPDVRAIIDWDFVGKNPKLITEHADHLIATPAGIMVLDWLIEKIINR